MDEGAEFLLITLLITSEINNIYSQYLYILVVKFR